jgi:hypothetical protein
LWYDAADHPGVLRASADLEADIERVTGRKPTSSSNRGAVQEASDASSRRAPRGFTAACPVQGEPVIIGTLGRSTMVDSLVAAGKLDARDLKGKWESFVITTVPDPAPGVKRAMVIAGSDKRGTIYGVCRQPRSADGAEGPASTTISTCTAGHSPISG